MEREGEPSEKPANPGLPGRTAVKPAGVYFYSLEECALGLGPLRGSSSPFLGLQAGEGKPN